MHKRVAIDNIFCLFVNDLACLVVLILFVDSSINALLQLHHVYSRYFRFFESYSFPRQGRSSRKCDRLTHKKRLEHSCYQSELFLIHTQQRATFRHSWSTPFLDIDYIIYLNYLHGLLSSRGKYGLGILRTTLSYWCLVGNRELTSQTAALNTFTGVDIIKRI